MRINHNITALNTYNRFSNASNQMMKSTEKLSSGLRINRAADDAAGLAISEKMRAQIRGLNQASRNIQDGISLLQTAEGGLNEVHSLLQRGRELSVQASNGTNTLFDREALQAEISQITEEIDRISETTQFNGINLLDTSNVSSNDKQKIIDYLQRSWLRASEQLVFNTLGINGGGANLTITLQDTIDGVGNTAARVMYSYIPGVTTTGSNIELQIDMADFSPPTFPNGGTGPFYSDRIIAHEMTHAVMVATVNVTSGMQTWFMEGVAEAVHGADERLAASLSSLTAQQVVDLIGTGTSAWGGTSDDYSMSYVAVRYMDHLLKTNGDANGVKTVLSNLVANNGNNAYTLDNAINDAFTAVGLGATINDASTFATNFKANGAAYIGTMNLTNADTGSLLGSDVTGNPADQKTATSVVDDTDGGLTNDPLVNFTELWPTLSTSTTGGIKIQIGANSSQLIDISKVDARSSSIGIDSVDVVNNAQQGIVSFDNAIKTVSSYRAGMGALQNRLEKAMLVTANSAENLTAAESRIRDVDMAKEMMKQTKHSILSQAAQAMLAQANQQPQGLLQLLR